jgi:5-methylcytosine-specific restriction enzyme subunit McrC
MGCQEAILIYPSSLPRPFEARVGDIRVRSLSFSLDGDVDESGYRFMRAVLAEAPVQKQRGELSAIYPI